MAPATGEHGAAGDEDGGDVQARGGDEHAGHDLVAGWDQYHGVELVALDGALHAIGDDLAADEAVVHALVVHRDAVAHTDGVDLQRRAAGHADARLDGVGDLLEVKVAGDDLVLCRDHGHERAVELLVGEAVGREQAPVGRSGKPALDGIAAQLLHISSLPLAVCEKCEVWPRCP